MDGKVFRILAAAFCLLMVLIVAASAIHGLRGAGSGVRPAMSDDKAVALAGDWLKAVKSGDAKAALAAASALVPDTAIHIPPSDYIEMASSNGVNSRFFNPPFNNLDFVYWLDCSKTKEIAAGIVGDSVGAPAVNKVFRAVGERMRAGAHAAKPPYKPCFPSDLWAARAGDLSEMYFLLSSLLEQLGFDTQVVFIFDSANPNSGPLHAVCEVRGNGVDVMVCDLFSGRIFRKPMLEIVNIPALVKGVWKEAWVKNIRNIVYATEAAAPAYRRGNQQLGEILDRLRADGRIPKDSPAIARDPIKRLLEFKAMALAGGQGNDGGFILWPNSFEQLKELPGFDRDWVKIQQAPGGGE